MSSNIDNDYKIPNAIRRILKAFLRHPVMNTWSVIIKDSTIFL